MAISVLRKVYKDPKYEYYEVDSEGIYAEFICDSTGDVSDLPTTYSDTLGFKPRPGSSAFICDDSSVYVLSPSRSWCKMEF